VRTTHQNVKKEELFPVKYLESISTSRLQYRPGDNTLKLVKNIIGIKQSQSQMDSSRKLHVTH